MRPAGVALGYWQDADPLEALTTATLADELGYRELWLGEMATSDAGSGEDRRAAQLDELDGHIARLRALLANAAFTSGAIRRISLKPGDSCPEPWPSVIRIG